MPEPHTLLSVEHAVVASNPAPSIAWRAGAWPSAAGSTHPMIASLMSSGIRPDSATTALIAAAASCGADRETNCPFSAPIVVRLAATMTTGSLITSPVLRLYGLTGRHSGDSLGEMVVLGVDHGKCDGSPLGLLKP